MQAYNHFFLSVSIGAVRVRVKEYTLYVDVVHCIMMYDVLSTPTDRKSSILNQWQFQGNAVRVNFSFSSHFSACPSSNNSLFRSFI